LFRSKDSPQIDGDSTKQWDSV